MTRNASTTALVAGRWFALLALAAAGLATRPAEAGIVVYANGNVVQGTIDPQETTPDSVTVHAPRVSPGGKALENGKVVVPRAEVRWVDTVGSALTDAYFERFGDLPLDPQWRRAFEKPVEPVGPQVTVDWGDLLRHRSARYTKSWPEGDLTLRPPVGATLKEGEIASFALGATAHVHVCSALAPTAAPSTQLEWIDGEIARLASEGDFALDGPRALTAVPGGHDARFATITRRRGSATLRALRGVFFRARRTYVVTCYAAASEFDRYRAAFEDVLETVRIDEGSIVDLEGFEAGQTWRWRSALRPDALVWDVTAKEAHSLRYRAAVDGVASQRELTAPARNDPRTVLLAAANVTATPALVGSEAVDLAGTSFPCSVYEARVEGKTYKLWISKRVPGAVRVTADGVVLRELADVKR